MRWLKILLVLNGAVFMLYALQGFVLPTSFWVPAGTAATTIDVVYAASVLQLTLGIIQVGTWRTSERWAVRLVAYASLIYAAAFAVVMYLASSHTSTDMFHQFGVVGAAAWLVFALLYAFLIYRERQEA